MENDNGKERARPRRRLRRQFVLACAVFVAALCLLVAAAGYAALLGAGMAPDSIQSAMGGCLAAIVGISVLLGALFLAFMGMWFARRVTRPIQRIEQVAGEFAQKSRGQSDPQALVLDFSDIRTGDELESLASALECMSRDMKEYAQGLLSSAEKARDGEQQMRRVSETALKDALTGVRNKAAFEGERSRIDAAIAAGEARFGLLMVDLNDLKLVNDTFGYEKGDAYIKAACDAVCTAFAHSPVFRVGGDEFVVLLERSDLENRYSLIARLRSRMEGGPDRQPWERASAAIGLAVYDSAQDDSLDSVLARADFAMHENKRAMKSGTIAR